MTQTSNINSEKDDPLKRIQEEIDEVARREREFREKMLLQQARHENNGSNATSPTSSPIPPISVAQEETLYSATPSLTSSINSKDDEHNSDDSGISASSSPVNGSSANGNKYIRPNGYTTIPSPPPQKLLTRAVSTPQIFTQNRRITLGPGQKGLMQRFIASRGKMAMSNNAQVNSTPATPITPSVNITNVDFARAQAYIPPVIMTPPIIARDADGKPIRRGYIPVEEKIQKELKDLKSRESELKKIRKIRLSTSDLLECINDEIIQSDDDDSDIEHCYGPGKLRSSKSISELCDSNLNERNTPSPDFESKAPHPSRGMRPAMSLAQLCDLDPEEAPSSHQLIAKWESLIQQNA